MTKPILTIGALLLTTLLLTPEGAPAQSSGSSPNGRPFQQLQGQTDNLQTQIDQEAQARAAADSQLQNAINAESAARTAGDSQLQSTLNAEAAARTAEDSHLQGQIGALQGEVNEGIVKGWAHIASDGSIISCFRCNFSQRFGEGQYQLAFTVETLGRFKVCVVLGKGFCDASDFNPQLGGVLIQTFGIPDGIEPKDRAFKVLIF